MLARRVLLVDDHPVFRTGLRRVLEATGRYEVVAEAGNAHEAIRAAEETRPGLILLDVQLPGITGLRITRILRRKQTRARIVVLSVHVDDDRIIEAVRAAVAFLQKDIGAEALTAALSRICAGENLLRAELLARPERRGAYAPSCGCRARLAAAKSRCRSRRGSWRCSTASRRDSPTRRSPTSSSSPSRRSRTT